MDHVSRVSTKLQREGWRLEAPLPHAHRWTSPLGQTLLSFVTNTEPRFVFAYNPRDNDMARMSRHGVLEPALTLAWHNVTRACCRDRRRAGRRVDMLRMIINFVNNKFAELQA